MSKLWPILYYLQHQWKAGTSHTIHSPFVHGFSTEVLEDNRHYYAFDAIEGRRKALLSDKTIIHIEDHGAGSHKSNSAQRPVCSIAKNALVTPEHGAFLFRLLQWGGYTRILELGTSLGISAAYMASASKDVHITTLEGSAAIASEAAKTWDSLGLDNIRSIVGTFNDSLPILESEKAIFDCIFLDGHHNYQPTLRYFEWSLQQLDKRGVIILDDIHWSKEMHMAWKEICQRPDVLQTVDLYYKGVVFVDPGFKHKQHVRLSL
jgi:predicted O-methyltransferase YrrM